MDYRASYLFLRSHFGGTDILPIWSAGQENKVIIMTE